MERGKATCDVGRPGLCLSSFLMGAETHQALVDARYIATYARAAASNKAPSGTTIIPQEACCPRQVCCLHVVER